MSQREREKEKETFVIMKKKTLLVEGQEKNKEQRCRSTVEYKR